VCLDNPLLGPGKGIKRVNGRYVVDENGERVAVLLDIEEYERMAAKHSAPVGEDALPCDDDEDLDPEEAERRITQFLTSADELPGPPVAELADEVDKLMRPAWRDIEMIMSGNPHNKLLAVQLFLGQRARGLQADDPEQWRLHAAVSLLSGMVIGSADKLR
jgi:hypothetical protein